MIAVFVNCISILLGSVIGLLFSKKITKEMSDHIQTAAGVVTIVLGIQMAFKYENIVFLTLSLIIGGVLGYLWNIDGKILSLGYFLQKVFNQKSNNDNSTINSIDDNSSQKNFAYAFLNSSVLFCVGAMAIVGSLKAGIEKDYSIIFTKSILDGFMAISFTAAMGIGTVFSALSVFLYQGALTLLSVFIKTLSSRFVSISIFLSVQIDSKASKDSQTNSPKSKTSHSFTIT